MDMQKNLWAVWFRGHIHTDAERKLAVFATRKEAKAWVADYGMPECKVGKLVVFAYKVKA